MTDISKKDLLKLRDKLKKYPIVNKDEKLIRISKNYNIFKVVKNEQSKDNA
jgi:hypothetical protein